MSRTFRVLHLISTVEVTLDSILNSKKMLKQYTKNQIHVYDQEMLTNHASLFTLEVQ